MKAKVKACGRAFCSVSTGICGSLTFGYGELDDYGYWKYGLRLATISSLKH